MSSRAESTDDAVLESDADLVTWSGGPVDGTGVRPEACAVAACDEFTVELALPADPWAQPGGLQVGIRWEHESDEVELFVYAPDGTEYASNKFVSVGESVLIPSAANGEYRVVVVPTLAEAVSYDGFAQVERPPAVEPVRELLPNLVALSPRDPRFQTSAYLFDLPVPSTPTACYPEETVEQGARRCMRFDQIVANFGDGPFEVRYQLDGIATEDTRDLVQRIYRSDGTYREQEIGTYVFHPAHAHFHYSNFAQARLWASDAAGDRLGDAPVRVGKKNGFCLVDVANVWFAQPGDAARTYSPPACLLPTDVGTAQGAAAVNGISVGWADVYNWYLADQFVDVADLPDGYYLLDTLIDPDGRVTETDELDNCTSTLIRLTAGLTDAERLDFTTPCAS